MVQERYQWGAEDKSKGTEKDRQHEWAQEMVTSPSSSSIGDMEGWKEGYITKTSGGAIQQKTLTGMSIPYLVWNEKLLKVSAFRYKSIQVLLMSNNEAAKRRVTCTSSKLSGKLVLHILHRIHLTLS